MEQVVEVYGELENATAVFVSSYKYNSGNGECVHRIVSWNDDDESRRHARTLGLFGFWRIKDRKQ